MENIVTLVTSASACSSMVSGGIDPERGPDLLVFQSNSCVGDQGTVGLFILEMELA